MQKLTNRQAEILEFLKEHIVEFGFPPTRADIARKLGFRSPNAAEEHLKALARKGAIEIIPGASRGLRIVEEEQTEPEGLPIVGQVAAGSPIMAIEHIDEYCQVPNELFHPRADYLLKVNGMSMKDIGIMDGDLLAVHKTQTAKNGDVVVARIDEEVTVKRFHQKANRVTLFAENEEFSPIEVDLSCEHFAIEGLSVGVIRRH